MGSAKKKKIIIRGGAKFFCRLLWKRPKSPMASGWAGSKAPNCWRQGGLREHLQRLEIFNFFIKVTHF